VLQELVEYNSKETAAAFNRRQQECQNCFVMAFGLDFRLIAGCQHAYCASCVRTYCEAAIRKEEFQSTTVDEHIIVNPLTCVRCRLLF
jgi:hypothetical protein